MAFRKYIHSVDGSSASLAPLEFSKKAIDKATSVEPEINASLSLEADADIDLREVYFLIMHFLSADPCKRTYGQLWNELLEHQLLPRRYHAWYSRTGTRSGDENDDGMSLPLCYLKLAESFGLFGRTTNMLHLCEAIPACLDISYHRKKSSKACSHCLIRS